MLTSDDWSVTIFKCKPDMLKDVLIDVYSFIETTEGVKDLHFIIRDRLRNQVIICFRVLQEEKNKKIISSKIAFKLRSLIPEENFVVDPDPKHRYHKLAAWPWKDMVNKRGPEKFSVFCSFLSKLSRIVVEMAKEDYFGSEERMELSHVMTTMLGCTELGLLSTEEMQVGYYDRVEDKSYTCLRQSLKKL